MFPSPVDGVFEKLRPILSGRKFILSLSPSKRATRACSSIMWRYLQSPYRKWSLLGNNVHLRLYCFLFSRRCGTAVNYCEIIFSHLLQYFYCWRALGKFLRFEISVNRKRGIGVYQSGALSVHIAFFLKHSRVENGSCI